MGDDPDSPPERDMKDFHFRQMKKTRVFEPPGVQPKERSSLLALSNKYGLTFVGFDRSFKVYQTQDILSADKYEGNSNEIVDGTPVLAEVSLDRAVHHLALSCDELTLSVCSMSEEAGLSLSVYDVRTLVNKVRVEKLPFASIQPAVDAGVIVEDLKWNPLQPPLLATCLSDGSMMILEVAESISVQAELPSMNGITCVCWSPKGKLVSAGKMNATVCQYTPQLQEKRVIPCPNFYSSENPVKVLDVLWLRSFVFAVVYAAADGSPETPPDLVVISLPKRDEKVETRYLNFYDPVYGSSAWRQHHYFLSQIEDWDVFFAASAASTNVSVIARQEDKNNWELWILEDTSRAELPVSEESEDHLPLGLAVDYTSQQEIFISDEKSLPPCPTMMLLSTDGLLCPFALLNLNPGAKQLVSPPSMVPVDGERLPSTGPVVIQPPKTAIPTPLISASFPPVCPTSASTPAPHALAGPSAVPFSLGPTAPGSSSGFAFSFAPSSSISTAATPAFSLGGTTAFGSGSSSGFSFGSKPPPDIPSASSGFTFNAPSLKPSVMAAPSPAPAPALIPTPAPSVAPAPQSVATASTPNVKLNLNERFSSVDTTAQAVETVSFSAPAAKTAAESCNVTAPPSIVTTKQTTILAPVPTAQTSILSSIVPKPAVGAPTPQALTVKALERQLQQKKDSDPVMTGILEEIAHFQKELDDLKARSIKADFKVGNSEEMKGLRRESDDLHMFTLEIRETTESLHGDIGTLKTTLLEGFAGTEEAKAQSELSKDRRYRQLLCKKPLDPRSEEHLKEIRRLYQYVTFAVEDVNVVLDVEWEKHLEKKKKHKHMAVPGREGLFTTLSNNLYIINQQKNRLDELIKELVSLHLYNKTSTWSTPPSATKSNVADAAPAGLDSELESLRESLLKAKLEVTSPKTNSKSPAKISPLKQARLRNFLSKGQMPPVRSTAPANLIRSAFLSPKYYEDLEDVSSSDSLAQSLELHQPHLELEEEELQPEPITMAVLPPALSTPRHPAVVRTPSIQPGFGGMSFALSPIPSPVPSNKINLAGADSTSLATKTVKHGAPPTEKVIPVPIPAQQAAATAAIRRQMANQKPGLASLTESNLSTVPQVVNAQDINDKIPSVPISIGVSSPVPAAAAPVIQQLLATVASTQAKRNSAPGLPKLPADGGTVPQAGFVFGTPSKADLPRVPVSSAEEPKGFSFTPVSTNFSFASATQATGMSQVKDVNKFPFNATGKFALGQMGEEPFSLTPKSASPALGSGSPALGSGSPTPPLTLSGDPIKPSSTSAALKVEPQLPKAIGGETLGGFSGLRVGQVEEAKETSTKAPGSFSFGDNGLGLGKGVGQFSFGVLPQKPGGEKSAADLSTGAVSGSSGSLFKPPESNAKPAFSSSQSSSTASAFPAFSSLLAAPLDSTEETNTTTHPSGPTPPPEPEAPAMEPNIDSTVPSAETEHATDKATPEPPGTQATTHTPTPTPPPPSASPTPALAPSSTVPPAEAKCLTEIPTPTTTEITADSTSAPAPNIAIVTGTPAEESVSQPPPPAYQVPASNKPGSIFTQSTIPTTDSNSIAVTPIISTVSPAVATPTLTTGGAASSSTNTVFGQPAATPASSASSMPSGPASTGFSSTGFGSATNTGFGKSIFGQVNGFGQPSSNSGTSAGFTFAQSAFGASSNTTTTGSSGGLFGSSTASSCSSFSFGSSNTNTSSSTGTGLFGQGTTPAFGQPSSGFGQPSVFGSNTTTSSSSGFSFGQPSAFGSSSNTSVFGQTPSSGSVFGQQQQSSSGGGLFGSSSASAAGSAGGSFFSGLGGKPSEEAANKNPFGATSSTGAFGPSNQTGANLFGNSGAKNFAFGQSSFGEQKPSGTFSTGGGSVASQGFGSFSTPTKQGGFGSAPVFGSPPSFGGSAAFGTAASFGSSPSFSGAMASTTNKVFGEGTAASSMGGFGFSSPSNAPSFGSIASQNAPTFGALAQQGSGFGSQPSTFSGFGQQPQGGAFSGSSFGSTNQSGSQTFASWRS